MKARRALRSALHEPGRPSLRPRLHDLDGHPAAPRRRHLGHLERRRLPRKDRSRSARQRGRPVAHARGPRRGRGSTGRGPRGGPDATPARPRSRRARGRARTRPDGSRPPRRIGPPRCRATSGSGCASIRRGRARHGPRRSRRSPPRSPAPASPRAPRRSRVARRRAWPPRPRPSRRPRPRGRDAGRRARSGRGGRQRGAPGRRGRTRAPRGRAAAAAPRRARPDPGPPPRRRGAARTGRARRPSGATYRSLTQRASASCSSSKTRSGDTAFLTASIRAGRSSVGPSTHPRTARPWKGTCTREPTPAPSSAGRSYVNGRSSERIGRSTQTATGPARTSGERGAEVVGAVGRLPGELLAPEVPVGRGLAVDRAQRGPGPG